MIHSYTSGCREYMEEWNRGRWILQPILGDLFGIEVDCKGIITERLTVLCYSYKLCQGIAHQ